MLSGNVLLAFELLNTGARREPQRGGAKQLSQGQRAVIKIVAIVSRFNRSRGAFSWTENAFLRISLRVNPPSVYAIHQTQ